MNPSEVTSRKKPLSRVLLARSFKSPTLEDWSIEKLALSPLGKLAMSRSILVRNVSGQLHEILNQCPLVNSQAVLLLPLLTHFSTCFTLLWIENSPNSTNHLANSGNWSAFCSMEPSYKFSESLVSGWCHPVMIFQTLNFKTPKSWERPASLLTHLSNMSISALSLLCCQPGRPVCPSCRPGASGRPPTAWNTKGPSNRTRKTWRPGKKKKRDKIAV